MSDTPTQPAPIHSITPRQENPGRRSDVTEIGGTLPEWSVASTHRDPAALAPGTLLHDKYVVAELLGAGGSGTVHRAHAGVIRREAAIKVQSDAAARDPFMRRRFVREMRLLAGIDHPGIVKVFEIGRLPDGHLVAALELLDGSSLRDVLRVQGALAPLRALEIAAQLCSALGAVHEQGVLHRDLKPANVMLLSDRRGQRVKLIDFGIACSIDRDAAPITTPAELVGTPGYMAPERTVLGSVVDARSDLFGLGVVLYEMLVGERPFGNSGASLARGIAEGPEPRRRALLARASVELTELTLSLLAPDASDRPASAADVLERIAALPEASGTALPRPRSEAPPEDAIPVMVIEQAPRLRDAWSRAVRDAGGRPIPLGSAADALMLLRHDAAIGPAFVLVAEGNAGELETWAGERDARLLGIVYVEPARLAGSAFASAPRGAKAEVAHRIAMPVTEADLRFALARPR